MEVCRYSNRRITIGVNTVSESVCRVTLVLDQRVLDLAVPKHLPVSDLLPALLPLLTAGRATPISGSWALSPLGHGPLSLGVTLDDAGITDGAVLLMTPAGQTPAPARQDHLLDVVADHVDGATTRWSSRATGEVVAAAASVCLLAGLFTMPALHVATPRTVVALAVVTVLLISAAVASSTQARVGSALLLTAAAIHASWVSLILFGGGLIVPATAALAVAGAGAVAARLSTRSLDNAAVFIATAAVVLGLAWTLDDPRGTGTVAFLVVLALGPLPRLVAGAGGLSALDYRLRSSGRVPADDVSASVQRSATLLTWALTGLSGAGAVLAIACAIDGTVWPLTLAALVGIAMMIRSRLFSRVGHVLPPLLAGLAILLACATVALSRTGHDTQLLAAVGVAAAAVIATMLSARTLRMAVLARLRLIIAILEAVAVIAAVPVLASVLGLFDTIGDIL